MIFCKTLSEARRIAQEIHGMHRKCDGGWLAMTFDEYRIWQLQK